MAHILTNFEVIASIFRFLSFTTRVLTENYAPGTDLLQVLKSMLLLYATLERLSAFGSTTA